MNSYIIKEVTKKLIIPKKIEYSDTLTEVETSGKNILLVSDTHCSNFSKISPGVLEEVMYSIYNKKNSVISLNSPDLWFKSSIYEQFNFVVSCSELPKSMSQFQLIKKISDSIFFYENIKKETPISLYTEVITIGNNENIEYKNNFIEKLSLHTLLINDFFHNNIKDNRHMLIPSANTSFIINQDSNNANLEHNKNGNLSIYKNIIKGNSEINLLYKEKFGQGVFSIEGISENNLFYGGIKINL